MPAKPFTHVTILDGKCVERKISRGRDLLEELFQRTMEDLTRSLSPPPPVLDLGDLCNRPLIVNADELEREELTQWMTDMAERARTTPPLLDLTPAEVRQMSVRLERERAREDMSEERQNAVIDAAVAVDRLYAFLQEEDRG